MSSSPYSSKPSSKTPSKPGKALRLNRFLAECGLGSRRRVEELVLDGRILVNGEVCRDLSCQVNPQADEVALKGKGVLSLPTEQQYLMLNKPRGYVVTARDEFRRQTIYDLLPERASKLRYAGRLDKDSEGLLLLTTDGELINRLSHPRYKVEKVYKATISRRLSKQELDSLRKGVQIEGGLTRQAGVFVKSSSESGMTLKFVITEGRKRQIRQMVEAVGAKVLTLKRLQFGTLHLRDLPAGRWRPLTQQEIRSLKSITGENKNENSTARPAQKR